MKKRMILLILIFFNLAVIFFFSHQTAEQSTHLSNNLSKQVEIHTPHYETKTQAEKNIFHANMQSYVRRSAHIVLFLCLGGLVLLLLFTDSFRWYRIVGAISFGAFCALGDEVHQLYVPGRTFQWEDIGSDIFGFLVGMFLVLFVTFMSHIVKKHKKRAGNG